MKCVKVKYHDENLPKLEKIGGNKSNWIDIRACKVSVNGIDMTTGKNWTNGVEYKPGDVVMIDFGFAAELPQGYEAYIVPRSSTFKNYGLIQTNHFGVIDESYCGNDDTYKGMYYALREGKIHQYERVAQFRIQEKMPDVQFTEVDDLGNENRGSYGSTGVK